MKYRHIGKARRRERLRVAKGMDPIDARWARAKELDARGLVDFGLRDNMPRIELAVGFDPAGGGQ